MDFMKKLSEVREEVGAISYDDLLAILYEFGRQHSKDYPSILIAGAVSLISTAKRYSFEEK